MKPVFKEELDCLGIDSKYEGVLWVDKRAYRAFNKNMELIKFGRKIDKLPHDTSDLMTHKEYCNRYYNMYTKYMVLEEKKELNKYLLVNKYKNYIISISGGKDSTVMGDITKQVLKELGVNFKTLFGNTSNETHHTYQYVKETYKDDNLAIANPKEGFYHWCDRNKFIPTRFARACCDIFKEGNILAYMNEKETTLQFLGMRKNESASRSNYEKIRKGKWKSVDAQNNWNMYLPIINFTDLDIWSYLIANNIKFNKLYKFGYGRVGCTNCPYRTKHELELNKHFLPTYDKRWKDMLTKRFIEDGTALNINCTLKEFLDGAWKAGVVRDEPTEEIIKEFSEYRNITIEQARKYFRTNRCDCGKRLSKDMIALNMKLLGRNTEARMCLKCLSEFLEVPKKQLKEDIKKFKQNGCNLF